MINPVNILKITLLFIVAPFIMGLSFDNVFSKKDYAKDNLRFSFARCFGFGFAIMLSIFHIVAVPCLIKRIAYETAERGFYILLVTFLLISLLINAKTILGKLKNKFLVLKKLTTKAVIIYTLAALFGCGLTGLLAFKMHTDTDDSRFIAEALEVYEEGTMITRNCITGEKYDKYIGELRKEVASPYPVFIGLAARFTKVHPAVLAHLVFPILFIPLSLIAFNLIGSFFFKGNYEKNGLFMLLMEFILLMSFESRYAFGYTLLTIIWQGRSVFAVIVLPLLFYVLARIMTDEKVEIMYYVSLMLLLIATADLSGTGIIISIAFGATYILSMLVDNFILSKYENRSLKFIDKIKRPFLTGIFMIPSLLSFLMLYIMDI